MTLENSCQTECHLDFNLFAYTEQMSYECSYHSVLGKMLHMVSVKSLIGECLCFRHLFMRMIMFCVFHENDCFSRWAPQKLGFAKRFMLSDRCRFRSKFGKKLCFIDLWYRVSIRWGSAPLLSSGLPKYVFLVVRVNDVRVNLSTSREDKKSTFWSDRSLISTGTITLAVIGGLSWFMKLIHCLYMLDATDEWLRSFGCDRK